MEDIYTPEKAASPPAQHRLGGDRAASANVAQEKPYQPSHATCPDCHILKPLPFHEWGSKKVCSDCLAEIRDPNKRHYADDE